eukprot:9480778-Pyramimonas_sp.AAC.2
MYGPAYAREWANQLREYCTSERPSKDAAIKRLDKLKLQLQKQKDAGINKMDPGTRATQSALQSGLHPPTQRVLMHAVVDNLRPEGP